MNRSHAGTLTCEAGSYTIVENSLLDNQNISSDARMLWILIARFANAERVAWPGRKLLAERMGRCLKTITKCIKELERFGWLIVHRSKDERGSNNVNQYHLLREQKLPGGGSAKDGNVTPIRRSEAGETDTSTLGDNAPYPRCPDAQTLGDEVHTNYTHRTTPNEVEHAREEKAAEEKPGGLARVLAEHGPGHSEARDPRMDEMFEVFWNLYPRRKGKLAARRTFAMVIRKKIVSYGELIKATDLYRKHYETLSADDKKFTKHPATWLNQGCWDDEIAEAKSNKFHIGF